MDKNVKWMTQSQPQMFNKLRPNNLDIIQGMSNLIISIYIDLALRDEDIFDVENDILQIKKDIILKNDEKKLAIEQYYTTYSEIQPSKEVNELYDKNYFSKTNRNFESVNSMKNMNRTNCKGSKFAKINS